MDTSIAGDFADHYHYWEEAANGYMESFQSTKLIRGHAVDSWEPPLPEDADVPTWVERIGDWRPAVAGRRYYANVKDFSGEEDFFPAKVFTATAGWLRDHSGNEPFYLQIESFDPHEPFHVPEPYASMYGDASGYDRFSVWPPYQNPERLREFLAQASPEEMDFIRAQYAGKLTMTDRWFGDLIKALDDLALWDDMVVIVTTDHGNDLGEHDAIGKQHPHYDSHANIPLFVWHPSWPGNGRTVTELTSTVDLFSSTLDIANASIPERTHGRSFVPLLTDQPLEARPGLLYGSFGQGACCTDGEWTIIKAPEHDGPLYSYSALQFSSLVYDNLVPPAGGGYFIPGVNLPQWQVPLHDRPVITTGTLSKENFLFNRVQDPGQTRNLWNEAPAQRKRMLTFLRDVMAAEGAPLEQYERLGIHV